MRLAQEMAVLEEALRSMVGLDRIKYVLVELIILLTIPTLVIIIMSSLFMNMVDLDLILNLCRHCRNQLI
jgi:hypothetical protein